MQPGGAQRWKRQFLGPAGRLGYWDSGLGFSVYDSVGFFELGDDLNIFCFEKDMIYIYIHIIYIYYSMYIYIYI